MKTWCLSTLAVSAVATEWLAFDTDWKFNRGASVDHSTCAFPTDLGDLRCMGLVHEASAIDADSCAAACCAKGASCDTYQVCSLDCI
jgi:hypothetical protein